MILEAIKKWWDNQHEQCKWCGVRHSNYHDKCNVCSDLYFLTESLSFKDDKPLVKLVQDATITKQCIACDIISKKDFVKLRDLILARELAIKQSDEMKKKLKLAKNIKDVMKRYQK